MMRGDNLFVSLGDHVAQAVKEQPSTSGPVSIADRHVINIPAIIGNRFITFKAEANPQVG